MHQRILRVAAAGLATLVALTACVGQQSGGGGTVQSEVLRLGMVAPNTSFAPWETAWAIESPYLQAVYDTLLRAEPDGTIVAGLAEKWEWDQSKTQLTLTLRDGVTFSDGTPLTAEVTADSLKRFRDGTAANAPYLSNVAKAEAVDAKTVLVTMKSPDPSLLTTLSQNAGIVGSAAMWTDPNAANSPVGSGPYVLDKDETVVGSSYVFDARADYWDADSVHYKTITMTLYGDATALMNAIKGGQVDATASQTPTQIPEAEAAGYKTTLAESTWAGFVLADRTGKLNPALKDVRVRQAINHALDREGLVKGLAAGYGSPTAQTFDKTSDAYLPELDTAYSFDVEKSKSLLREAGYPNGFDLLMPSSNFVPEAEFAVYKEQLGKVGINVTWETTGDDLFRKMLGGTWAAFPMNLETPKSGWAGIQFALAPWAPFNVLKTEDPKILEYMSQLSTAEGDDAKKISQDLNRYVVEQAWFAPTYRAQTAFFTKPGIAVELQSDNAYPYLWNIKSES
ncbi:ABC transporter substrate-binding protein [Arthrobacter sp. StoSoilB20]|uniref:ABC transporter substrate-binding protein n=1 Tax=Arthrobacter sp. StoSoilB20 TaxID=2830995 RepID=UPI001CC55B96|nr:ABC transporter substrate-binding protein [Arthrobacter sp. StoSoilB20]BCW58646.1 peptide ABC transporter substrate-binding protein [Arthrobacter sp. StoSoilB20]